MDAGRGQAFGQRHDEGPILVARHSMSQNGDAPRPLNAGVKAVVEYFAGCVVYLSKHGIPPQMGNVNSL